MLIWDEHECALFTRFDTCSCQGYIRHLYCGVLLKKVVFVLVIETHMATKTKSQQAFDNAFLEDIKQQLTERKKRIEEELGLFTKENPNVPGDREAEFPDYGTSEEESALEVAEFTANKPLEITLEKELRDIDKALKRLDEGIYGICKYCDKPIDPKRLLARPSSSSCVECKKTLTDEA